MGRRVWTQERLYQLLNTLVDVEPPLAPLVARACYRRKGHGGEHNYPVEEYELTNEGRHKYRAYVNDEDISYEMPLPLYLLQVRGLRTALSPQDRPPPLSPRRPPPACVLPALCLSQLGDVGGDVSDDSDALVSDEDEKEVDGHMHYIPDSCLNKQRKQDGTTEYAILWKQGDVTWENAKATPFVDSSQTWRDTLIVDRWEAARRAGTLLVKVRIKLKLQDGGKVALAPLVLDRVVPVQSAAEVAHSSMQRERHLEERALAKQAATAEKERLEANAQGIIAKLPWPMRYALLACGGSSGTVSDYQQRIVELDVRPRSRTIQPRPNPRRTTHLRVGA